MPENDNVHLLAEQLLQIPIRKRGQSLLEAVSFRPSTLGEFGYEIGELRSSFAACWLEKHGEHLPFEVLRQVLTLPVSIAILIPFMELNYACNQELLAGRIGRILDRLRKETEKLTRPIQAEFIQSVESLAVDELKSPVAGQAVSTLDELITAKHRFQTIYADPPWRYDNTHSRGAAENHYPTLSVDELCRLPVRLLSEENAHLHLWTTNAFLRDSYEVMDAWGFQFKSCFVWVKNELGMGNYWRVSHEFLLLGVKGTLPFESKKERSWLLANRTSHSRKPASVREQIERVSPGPYLELFGRELLPNSSWTVFGNQIEDLLF